MQKKLLLVGGIVNALFFFFHLLLGQAFHKMTGLPADVHALLQMLNAGGTLFILFFALACLFYAKEVLSTALGRLSLLFCALLYGTRALEEIVWAPEFSPIIFIVCALVAILFAVICLLLHEKPN